MRKCKYVEICIDKILYPSRGFKLEGVEREANFVDGRWEDVYNMGILESEWGGVDKRAVDRSWKVVLECSSLILLQL